MKTIPLTLGQVALVDDENYDSLAQFKWYAIRGHSTFYARRATYSKNKQTIVRMHREIIKVPFGFETDHIDGNGLNNQRSNLRIVTQRENAQNQHISKTSRFVGVSWAGWANRWASCIRINNKTKHLGYFKDESIAALRYKLAVMEL